MATLSDIGVSAFINILGAFAFLLAFALLRLQPINDRVYFPKWYISGKRSAPRHVGNFVGKFVNLNFKTYLTFLNWMPQAMKMSEDKIIEHAGLDSAVFLRIYALGLKIFVPTAIVALLVLIPVNVSDGILFFLRKDLVVSDIDKLSISNIKPKSWKFVVLTSDSGFICNSTISLHPTAQVDGGHGFQLGKQPHAECRVRLLTLDPCGLTRIPIESHANKELQLVDMNQVLVRNVPHESKRSISDNVENFFKKNHPDHYLCHQAVYNANKFAKLVRKRARLQNWLDYNQLKFERKPEKRPTTKTGFLGLWGERVDSIDYYKQQLKEFDRRLTMERESILKNSKSIMPAAFVSFNSRCGAAVCAQTQQSKNPTLWLTNWAPEPRDVYWNNLSISFFSLSLRKLLISVAVFALVFFYMIPIAFVQSLANLEGLEKVAPFLRPLIEWKVIKSFLQGFLPGLALKIFLFVLPSILMFMSKIEGHVALSVLERRTAAKYYYFMLVNVFLGSIVAGTAFQQLHAFLHQSANEIPRNIGVSIPMKATFFITYIMVDGWAGIAGEILRLKPLVIFHLKNMFLVKTERDVERAMDPGSVDFPETLPSLQLYFLLGIVYAVVTPILLPFILVFFAFAYLVYRHQVINVYNQQYESCAAFWPHVHGRIIASLVISQLLLMGLLSTKKAAKSTPFLVALPVLTLAFHKYCKSRFEPAFRKYPIEEAMEKDLQDRSSESDANLKAYLADAYLHPIFHSFEEIQLEEVKVDKKPPPDSPSPPLSELSSPSPTHDAKHHKEGEPFQASQTSHNVQHYEVGQPGDLFHYEVEQTSHVYHYDYESQYHHDSQYQHNGYHY
ncbi:CSC1-like protein [Capsicum annuum]|nr:CSC1-like protein [Capsicum annuum]